MAATSEMKIKVTYFDIEAVAEKLRLALAMTNTPFEDERIKFPDWGAMKATVKYQQLPVLEVDGEKMYQSSAQLKFLGKLGDGSLYPVQDAKLAYKVDLMLGLQEDMDRAFNPSLMLAMRQTTLGYPEEWAEKDATVKAVREKFVKEMLPVHMEHLTEALKEGGSKFVCGDTVTIADLQWLPKLRYFTKGVADHVPKDCLNAYPEVLAYIERMLEVPQIKEWYSKH